MLKHRHLPQKLIWLKLLAVFAGLLAALTACTERQQRPETLTIAFSNDVEGVIRACGCATNDFGGMGRRATFVRSVRDTTENFLLVDAGDFFGTEMAFGPKKAEVTMRSMVLMDYHAVVIGEKEFGFGLNYIVEKTAETGLPVIVANLRYAETDQLVFPPSRTVTLPSGLSVGLIGVISPQIEFPPQVPEGTLRITDPAEAVETGIGALADSVDVLVLIAHGTRIEAAALARRFPEIGAIVLGHEARPVRKGAQRGPSHVLQVAREGRQMGVAFAVLDENKTVRSLVSQSTQLSKQFADDKAVVELFHSFDMRMTTQETLRGD